MALKWKKAPQRKPETKIVGKRRTRVAVNEQRRAKGQKAVERMRAWHKNGSTKSPVGMAWLGHCAHAVAQAHGHYASIWPSAQKGWDWTHPSKRHSGKKMKNPPRGSLVFYRGGRKGYGHVGVANGRGKVWQVDINENNKIGLADIDAPVKKWGMTLLGWVWADEVSSW